MEFCFNIFTAAVCLLIAVTTVILLVFEKCNLTRTECKDGDRKKRFFQVLDKQSGRRCIIKFEHPSDFKQSCKNKFGYRQDRSVVLELEDRRAKLDDSTLELLPNNTTITIGSIKGMVLGTWSSLPIEWKTSGAEKVKQELRLRGKDNLADILEEAVRMPVQPLVIAVIGSSGQGKSKLINTLTNLCYGDEGYAKVGVIETTKECTAYHCPLYPNLVFWDVPGVGTKTFSREKYTSKIKFDRYNFFLICSAARFTTDDTWLLKEIQRRKKNCYLLRTMVDIDIENTRGERGSRFNENELLQDIRHSCHQNLQGDYKLFLISSLYNDKYEFPLFLRTLIHDAPLEQKHSLNLDLLSVSVEMIEQKATYLKNDIRQSMSPSVRGGSVPFMWFLFGPDMVLIKSKLKAYQRRLELTDADIKRYARAVNLPVAAFRQRAGLKLDFDFLDSQGLNHLVKGMSYGTEGKLLEQLLNDCKNDAISVFTTAVTRKFVIP